MENIGALTQDERNYLERYVCLLSDMKQYKEECATIDRKLFMEYLRRQYASLGIEVVEEHILKVRRIYRDYQKKLNNQVREQKGMILRMKQGL